MRRHYVCVCTFVIRMYVHVLGTFLGRLERFRTFFGRFRTFFGRFRMFFYRTCGQLFLSYMRADFFLSDMRTAFWYTYTYTYTHTHTHTHTYTYGWGKQFGQKKPKLNIRIRTAKKPEKCVRPPPCGQLKKPQKCFRPPPCGQLFNILMHFR